MAIRYTIGPRKLVLKTDELPEPTAALWVVVRVRGTSGPGSSHAACRVWSFLLELAMRQKERSGCRLTMPS